MPRKSIRDFIYLDWERVRSYSAQLFGGVPESRTESASHSGGAEGSANVGVPLLGKAELAGNYTLTRSHEETRSLHHWAYLQLEELLTDEGLLLEVDAIFANERWEPDVFTDGQFVSATGPIQLIDYLWIASTLNDFDSFVKMISQFQLIGDLTTEERTERQREHQKMSKDVKALRTSDMAEVIQRLYHDSIQIRIAPSRTRPQRSLIGVAMRDAFYDTAMGLARKYGRHIDAGWRVVCQVNVPSHGSPPVTIPSGNTMDDSLEKVAAQLTEMAQVSSSVAFPAFSMTPLAVYRTISS
jgi:hypothetical protein